MELRITNPQESWLTEQILWNNEELKAAIAEKVKDYKTIAYTEDSLKDMKADRADLNKLKKLSRTNGSVSRRSAWSRTPSLSSRSRKSQL